MLPFFSTRHIYERERKIKEGYHPIEFKQAKQYYRQLLAERGDKNYFGLCCRLGIVSSSLHSGFRVFVHQDSSIKLVVVTVPLPRQRNT